MGVRRPGVPAGRPAGFDRHGAAAGAAFIDRGRLRRGARGQAGARRGGGLARRRLYGRTVSGGVRGEKGFGGGGRRRVEAAQGGARGVQEEARRAREEKEEKEEEEVLGAVRALS